MGLDRILAKLFSKPADDTTSEPATAWRLIEGVAKERRFTIVDVGAQNLASETHVYAPLCRSEIDYRIIGFEPIEERASERSASDDDARTTIYPVAIGDGKSHTLYVNNDDATSSFFPIDEKFCADFEHLNTLHGVSTVQFETKRLDEVLPPAPIEFLKLDIQGAELLALQNATRVLDRTAAIHCEVEFDQIYRGQPLFHDVSALAKERGFYLVDLIIAHRYYYENSREIRGADRLLWADAVFFKSSQDKDVLAAQAVIAALVYNKLSLAQRLLDRIG